MKFDKIFTKEFLEKEYVQEKKTKWMICREQQTTPHTLNKYLKKYGITNNKLCAKRIKLANGQKINRWTIIHEVESIKDKRHYLCVCDCGNKKVVAQPSLRNNLSKSCGCLGREQSSTGYKDISGSYWRRAIESAVDRGYNFDITIEYAWDKFVEQNGKCALSGLDIILVTNQDKSYKQTASLDRIDSTKGYVEGNIQWLHKNINAMKKAFSENDFLFYIRKIVDNTIDREIKEPDFINCWVIKGFRYEDSKERVS